MTFETQLSSLLDLIYEAPLTGDWQKALDGVCTFISAAGAELDFVDVNTDQVTRIVTTGLDPSSYEKYLRDYCSDISIVNARVPIFFRKRQDDVWADSDIWTPNQRSKTPYFAEFIHPYFGVKDALNTWVRRSPDGRDDIAFLVHYFKGHAAAECDRRRRFQMIIHHLRRAVSTEERLSLALRENAVLHEALDKVREAVALIDSNGKLIHANAEAIRVFRESSGITVTPDGRVQPSTSEARTALSHALSRCGSRRLVLNMSDGGPPEQVAITRIDRLPLVLTVQPLPQEIALEHKADALLFITDTGAKPANLTQTLRSVFKLSPAETRLAQALGDGDSLKEIAERQQVSYETVRTQLKHTLSKTGTKRQSELMALLHTLR